MSLLSTLTNRAQSKCELCGNTENLKVYELPPVTKADESSALLACSTCTDQITNPDSMDANHWRCLNESMWSEHKPVQIAAWRALSLLKNEAWAQDLISQMYLEDADLELAKSGLPEEEEIDSGAPTLDSNGAQLMEGDSVTLIKDLDVKGGGFTAKRGTLVRNITLTNNPKHIEGKVNGIQIVLVAAFLKKA